MKANNIANMSEMRNYFQTQVQNVVAKTGKSVVFWEEVFNGGFDLQKDTVIDVWLSNAELDEVVKAGHRAVQSWGWYLDQQIPPGPQHYFWLDTWQSFYGEDPLRNTTLTPEQQKLVLGGETSMWGEQVDDTDIDARIWPRASAIAERLWSPASVNDISEATPRLYAQRCHMVQQGVGACPIRPGAVTGVCHLPPGNRFAV